MKTIDSRLLEAAIGLFGGKTLRSTGYPSYAGVMWSTFA
jgi:hypothetical protein